MNCCHEKKDLFFSQFSIFRSHLSLLDLRIMASPINTDTTQTKTNKRPQRSSSFLPSCWDSKTQTLATNCSTLHRSMGSSQWNPPLWPCGGAPRFDTKQNGLTLESGLLYIKRVSEICSDSYMFFHFLPLGLYHRLRSFINDLA